MNAKKDSLKHSLQFYKLVKVVDDPLTYCFASSSLISFDFDAAVLSDSENLYISQT